MTLAEAKEIAGVPSDCPGGLSGPGLSSHSHQKDSKYVLTTSIYCDSGSYRTTGPCVKCPLKRGISSKVAEEILT